MTPEEAINITEQLAELARTTDGEACLTSPLFLNNKNKISSMLIEMFAKCENEADLLKACAVYCNTVHPLALVFLVHTIPNVMVMIKTIIEPVIPFYEAASTRFDPMYAERKAQVRAEAEAVYQAALSENKTDYN